MPNAKAKHKYWAAKNTERIAASRKKVTTAKPFALGTRRGAVPSPPGGENATALRSPRTLAASPPPAAAPTAERRASPKSISKIPVRTGSPLKRVVASGSHRTSLRKQAGSPGGRRRPPLSPAAPPARETATARAGGSQAASMQRPTSRKQARSPAGRGRPAVSPAGRGRPAVSPSTAAAGSTARVGVVPGQARAGRPRASSSLSGASSTATVGTPSSASPPVPPSRVGKAPSASARRKPRKATPCAPAPAPTAATVGAPGAPKAFGSARSFAPPSARARAARGIKKPSAQLSRGIKSKAPAVGPQGRARALGGARKKVQGKQAKVVSVMSVAAEPARTAAAAGGKRGGVQRKPKRAASAPGTVMSPPRISSKRTSRTPGGAGCAVEGVAGSADGSVHQRAEVAKLTPAAFGTPMSLLRGASSAATDLTASSASDALDARSRAGSTKATTGSAQPPTPLTARARRELSALVGEGATFSPTTPRSGAKARIGSDDMSDSMSVASVERRLDLAVGDLQLSYLGGDCDDVFVVEALRSGLAAKILGSPTARGGKSRTRDTLRKSAMEYARRGGHGDAASVTSDSLSCSASVVSDTSSVCEIRDIYDDHFELRVAATGDCTGAVDGIEGALWGGGAGGVFGGGFADILETPGPVWSPVPPGREARVEAPGMSTGESFTRDADPVADELHRPLLRLDSARNLALVLPLSEDAGATSPFARAIPTRRSVDSSSPRAVYAPAKTP